MPLKYDPVVADEDQPPFFSDRQKPIEAIPHGASAAPPSTSSSMNPFGDPVGDEN